MEFELHDVKFNYEYGNVYRCYHLKKGDVWKERKIQSDGNGYKRFQFCVNKKIYSFSLHRLVYWLHNPEWDIMDSSRDNAIDHIDGNRLNNNIENLRLVTQQENNWNQTRAKGYTWNKGRWQSKLKLNNKTINLGRFDNEEDARNAYLEAKKKYHIINS
tara:strand:+ start:343 stop:819 length:477 start_codon:yes stop_codon:yes gene_type:complete